MAGTEVFVLSGAPTGTFGASREPRFGTTVYQCDPARFPSRLAPYLPVSHSWEAMVQRFLNGRDYEGTNPGREVQLRAHQRGVVEQIVAAHRAGLPGFTLAYPTGSGKTIMTLAAINRIAPARVLVISTLSHLTGWRKAISTYGAAATEWVVINPDQLGTALTDPNRDLHTMDVTSRDRFAAVSGVPVEPWDVVVCDEAHMITSPVALRSRLWRRHTGWSETGPAAFTLNLSATPWSKPTETSPAAHLIAHAQGVPAPSEWTVNHAYSDWLNTQGFAMVRDERGRWRWNNNPTDVAKVQQFLFGGGRGAAATAPELGLPAQPRRIHPITLSDADRAAYEQSWVAFRAERDLDVSLAWDPRGTLSEALRNVQQASLLKSPHVAALVVDLVREGKQVIVPTWFQETSTDLAVHIQRGLSRVATRDETWRVVRVTGDDSVTDRETKRRLFQSGLARVIVTSITESINLHAGEEGGGVDHSDATTTPRVTVFADVLTGGKRSYQAEGRATRDAHVAEAIYTYADDTTEQRWLAGVFRSMADTRSLSTTQPSGDRDMGAFMQLADELDPQEQP